jgi:hypothetical protein
LLPQGAPFALKRHDRESAGEPSRLDLGYRIWDFDYESDEDLKRLDMALAGFGGGVTFHF